MIKTGNNCQIFREESILQEINRFSFCPNCLLPSYLFCASCNVESLKVIIYLHNVPKINGFLEKDEECTAC